MKTDNKNSLFPVPCSLFPILVVPACESGRGGGHLVRSMSLVRELKAMGRDAWLYISSSNADAVLDTAQFDRGWLLAESGLLEKSWQCIILDRFQTPPEELAYWQKMAPVIGIDEGGGYRVFFDFLIDILPNCDKKTPNIARPSLLPLPKNKPRPSSRPETEPLKVLISFGLEDSAGLGPALAKTFALRNHKNIEITLLTGNLSKEKNYCSLLSPTMLALAHCSLKETIPNLNEYLTDYDLIITHFGLTSFEALYAGVPVLLASPTVYHEKLAKKAGFWTLGIGNKRKEKKEKRKKFGKRDAEKKLSALLKKGIFSTSYFSGLKEHCAELAIKFGLDREPQQRLGDLVNSLMPDVSRDCPACGAALEGQVLARFAERSYLRCKSCGAISMNRINPMPIEYDKDYFFEQYQKQYGKTYIEDFPNLTAMAKRRLALIKKVGSKPRSPLPTPHSLNLLDIGCAYGAFLAAAREEGFFPRGIDPAEDAVHYVKQTLGIPAVQGYFPNPECNTSTPHSPFPTPQYEVITLWYVIEHFRDCVPALAEIRKQLKSGGVLAFATPSFAGISGRSSLKRFLENSPQDHWTVWSPAVCGKAMRKAGFKVKKIVSGGHHPERFPFFGKFAHNRNSLLYRLLMAISKIFALGDTIEVYAVNEANPL
jgi:2-polyprenyl-3-methyl-5-hydroxy-6-metoxy-1,4-benzoquinol methylase/spore coat polysaccharide biosynthesis predicted glycosyltransferase SpsG